jgi:hypothetical protein
MSEDVALAGVLCRRLRSATDEGAEKKSPTLFRVTEMYTRCGMIACGAFWRVVFAALAVDLFERGFFLSPEGGRLVELRTSATGTAEMAAIVDIYPKPRLVLRPARAS